MNWQCPFCQRYQVLTGENLKSEDVFLQSGAGSPDSNYAAMRISSIVCASTTCKRRTISVGLHNWANAKIGQLNEFWQLRPNSGEKPQPEYIPESLREDYSEACKIRNLSSKASATLARRCLQGMIRDFCGITKNRLVDEINELKARVDGGTAPSGVAADTMEAIDAVRSVGNIGAHMEKDINVIVEIDSDEAQMLIELIEMLFEEWYVARHVRQERLASIKKLAEDKKPPPKA